MREREREREREGRDGDRLRVVVLGALISLPSLVFVCPTVLPLLPPVLFESLFLFLLVIIVLGAFSLRIAS